MTYNGPGSGSINIVPADLSGQITGLPEPPNASTGLDGDFAFDPNVNLLYGPKDSTQISAWPNTGFGVGSKLFRRGIVTSTPWLSAESYNTNDVVNDTYTRQQFLCIKSIDYSNAVPWSTTGGPNEDGSYPAGSFVTYSGTMYINILDVDYLAVPSAASSWLAYDLLVDSANSMGYKCLGNWLQLPPALGPDIGRNSNAILSIPQRVLLQGDYPISPYGVYTDFQSPGNQCNYLVDSRSVESDTLTLGGSWPSSSPTPDAFGAGRLVEIKNNSIKSYHFANDALNYTYAYINTNPLFSTVYEILATDRFTELGSVGITTIRLPGQTNAAPTIGQIFWIRNSSTVNVTITTPGSGGVIKWAGNSASSFTLAAGATTHLMYTGSNTFIRTTAFDASQITTGTLESLTINNATVKGGGYTAFTLTSLGTVPLVNFDSNAQIVNAHFNTGGAYFYGSSGTYSTLLKGSSTASATVTLPGSAGTLVGTGDTGSVTSTMIANLSPDPSGTFTNASITVNSKGLVTSASTGSGGGGSGTTTNSLVVGTTGLKATSGTSPWNGSAAITIDIDNTKVPTISGGNTLAFTTSGATSLTVPTSGTLATLGANTFTANQNLNSNKLTSVTDPTAAQDAATKNYVDTNQRDYVKTTSATSTGPATLHRLDIRDTFTPSSATTNNVFSGYTVSPVTATKTWNCRFSVSALGSGVSIKVGVWSSSGDGSFNTTLLGSTGIITPSSISALTTGAFSSSFTLTAGTAYYVGMGVTWSTTAPTIRGFGSTTANTAALPSHILVLTPIMTSSGSWAASGNALPVTNLLNNQQFIPWIELY